MALRHSFLTACIIRWFDCCIAPSLNLFSTSTILLRFSDGRRKMRFLTLLIFIIYTAISTLLKYGILALPSEVENEADAHDLLYIRSQEHDAFMASTEPDPNLKTIVRSMRIGCVLGSLVRRAVRRAIAARTEFLFRMGFRNMVMAFFYIVLFAVDNGFQQIYLPSLCYEDYDGSYDTPTPHVPHELLFDVVYWNSFYPRLPRLVRYHPSFTDISNTTEKWMDNKNPRTATKPYPSPRLDAFTGYVRYRNRWHIAGKSHPADALSYRAMQPCPDMRRLLVKKAPSVQLDLKKSSLTGPDNQKATLSLHARVEPDMLMHWDCRKPYVANIETILRSLYIFFPNAPFSVVRVSINRRMMEEAHNGGGGRKWNKTKSGRQKLNSQNLEILNQIRDAGMWNGTVKVNEYGVGALKGTRFMQYPHISGAMIDFFIAVDAAVFVGSPASTWSYDVVQARVYAGNFENYMYFPDGIRRVTDDNATMAPNTFAFCGKK